LNEDAFPNKTPKQIHKEKLIASSKTSKKRKFRPDEQSKRNSPVKKLKKKKKEPVNREFSVGDFIQSEEEDFGVVVLMSTHSLYMLNKNNELCSVDIKKAKTKFQNCVSIFKDFSGNRVNQGTKVRVIAGEFIVSVIFLD
jgi:hypothetical protein